MLIDFFYTLRSAKLPVSVKEYLTLLEALQANVVGPNSDDAYKIDDFYYLSRTALVKDEKHFDKFDRAFAAYFKGVEMIADFTKDVPLEWLRKNLELELSPEEKAKIEKMGWDELMEATSGSAPAAPRPSAPMARTRKASASARKRGATRAR